jgi:4-hydroxybenzoate polyprenyltransferase
MSLAEAVRPTVPAWRAWLHIARVSNTPTVVSNAVAGALLASTAAETGTVALVALAMALFYTAGMVLNDLADAEVDRRERPERPIPSGAISPAAALAAFCALVAAGLAILATEDVAPLLAGVGLVVLIVLYDLWHKDNPVSPALMAGCRALVYVIAGVAVASELPGDLWGAVALLFVYVVGLTRVAKVEGGGIIGAWPVVAVLAPSVYWAFQLPSAASFLLLAAFAAWTLWALHLVHARRIGHAVGALIAGIALFDALAVASVEGAAAAVGVCLAAFLATIGLQTRISGT